MWRGFAERRTTDIREDDERLESGGTRLGQCSAMSPEALARDQGLERLG